jgi:hypothetical protein
MRVTTIVIDGLNEEDFRRSVQNRLREGRIAPAIARLRTLLAPYAGPDGPLPERFLTVTAAELIFSGWESLGDGIARHDRPGRPVTALGIAFGWAGEEVPQPDAEGRLQPHLETAYFNDDSFPFSQSSRDDLLEGYSSEGCTWGGDNLAVDTALVLHGIDDLYGALAALEDHLLASDEPDEALLVAGSIAACLLSALLVEAVKVQIANHGLPRPVCVTAGSNGVYPYFDAPIAGMPADVLKTNENAEDMVPADQGVPVPRYSSLLVTSIPRARKRAVLVLNENEDETAHRLAGLRQLHDAEPAAPIAPAPVPERFEPGAPEPEPVMAHEAGGLLLAKKPPKTSGDFREMLAPREGDLQQRLQSLLATHAPRPEEAGPLPEPSTDWEPEAGPPADPAGLVQEIQTPAQAPVVSAAEPEWFEDDPRPAVWSRLKGWLGGLGRWRAR